MSRSGDATESGLTVVVGAAQGIGREIARRLAAEQWTSRIVLADVKPEGCRDLADELGAGVSRLRSRALM